ncbi:hypothetical protein Barb6XT_03080 [Bacteroidales bacterium Barb6XT]|nr:hypothetical protein Barb6XT_03080 [Bacteroidales bacterium Barb6XT]
MENKNQYASEDAIESNLLRLRRIFPNLSVEWFVILKQRIISHQFTESELENAVNYAIDTCEYSNSIIPAIIRHKLDNGDQNHVYD